MLWLSLPTHPNKWLTFPQNHTKKRLRETLLGAGGRWRHRRHRHSVFASPRVWPAPREKVKEWVRVRNWQATPEGTPSPPNHGWPTEKLLEQLVIRTVNPGCVALVSLVKWLTDGQACRRADTEQRAGRNSALVVGSQGSMRAGWLTDGSAHTPTFPTLRLPLPLNILWKVLQVPAGVPLSSIAPTLGKYLQVCTPSTTCAGSYAYSQQV